MATRAVFFTLPVAAGLTILVGITGGLGALGLLILYSALGQILLASMLATAALNLNRAR